MVTSTVGSSSARIEQAGQSRFARVEALRAVGALGVLAAHIWGYSQGWQPPLVYGSFLRRAMMSVGQVGVPVFFAASGYLLYLPFARRDFGVKGGAVNVRQYAINRARRIFPLYYVALVVTLLVWNGGGTLDQWWRFVFFWENFTTHTEGSVIGPAWTLVIDLQFYILLPILAVGLARLARGRISVATGALLATGIASVWAWRYSGHFHGPYVRLWQHNFPACWCFLVPGMLLALLRVHIDRGERDWKSGVLGNPDLWVLAALPFAAFATYRLDWQPVNTVSAFLILSATALPLRPGRLMRALDWRPLALLGAATYSIYIWQVQIMDSMYHHGWLPGSYVGMMAVVVPICVAVGIVSYIVIERPFLTRRRTWSPDEVAKNQDEAAAPVTTEATAETITVPATVPAS